MFPHFLVINMEIIPASIAMCIGQVVMTVLSLYLFNVSKISNHDVVVCSVWGLIYFVLSVVAFGHLIGLFVVASILSGVAAYIIYNRRSVSRRQVDRF